MCWRIVNKEGDVFRRPQEGWGTTRVYIPVTAAKGIERGFNGST